MEIQEENSRVKYPIYDFRLSVYILILIVCITTVVLTAWGRNSIYKLNYTEHGIAYARSSIRFWNLALILAILTSLIIFIALLRRIGEYVTINSSIINHQRMFLMQTQVQFTEILGLRSEAIPPRLWKLTGGKTRFIIEAVDGTNIKITGDPKPTQTIIDNIKRILYPDLLREYKAYLDHGLALNLGNIRFDSGKCIFTDRDDQKHVVNYINIGKSIILLETNTGLVPVPAMEIINPELISALLSEYII